MTSNTTNEPAPPPPPPPQPVETTTLVTTTTTATTEAGNETAQSNNTNTNTNSTIEPNSNQKTVQIQFIYGNKKKTRYWPYQVSKQFIRKNIKNTFPELKSCKCHIEYDNGTYIEDSEDWKSALNFYLTNKLQKLELKVLNDSAPPPVKNRKKKKNKNTHVPSHKRRRLNNNTYVPFYNTQYNRTPMTMTYGRPQQQYITTTMQPMRQMQSMTRMQPIQPTMTTTPVQSTMTTTTTTTPMQTVQPTMQQSTMQPQKNTSGYVQQPNQYYVPTTTNYYYPQQNIIQVAQTDPKKKKVHYVNIPPQPKAVPPPPKPKIKLDNKEYNEKIWIEIEKVLQRINQPMNVWWIKRELPGLKNSKPKARQLTFIMHKKLKEGLLNRFEGDPKSDDPEKPRWTLKVKQQQPNTTYQHPYPYPHPYGVNPYANFMPASRQPGQL